jgi:hypothetical protein
MTEVGLGIIFAVASLFMVAVVLVTVLSRVHRASATRSLAVGWPHTMGTVLSATVQVGNGGSARPEAPLVLYAYQVDGQVFQGHCVRIAGEPGRSQPEGAACSASSTVARYPSGASVIVYYDPANPANSALER